MSKYTTSIYIILKNLVHDSDTMTNDEIVENGVELFFDFDFPWYADNLTGKKDFCKEYLTYYMPFEIGQETLGLHKQCFKRVMIENMEKLRQKYELLLKMVNVAGGRNLSHEETINENETTNATSNQTQNSTAKRDGESNTQSIDSDNPQVTFAENDYASSMNRGESTATQTDVTNSNTDISNDATREGNTVRKVDESETDTRDNYKYFDAINKGVYTLNTELLLACRKLFMKLW